MITLSYIQMYCIAVGVDENFIFKGINQKITVKEIKGYY